MSTMARIGLALLSGCLAWALAGTALADGPTLGCEANGLTPTFGSSDSLNGYGTSLPSDETWERIEGDPLIIAAGSRGSIAVWVCQPSPEGVTRQYYAEYAWGTMVHLRGTDTSKRYASLYGSNYGATRFTASSHTASSEGSVHTIRTVVDLGGDAQLARIITYTDGAYSYRIRFELTNTSGIAHDDVRLMHGGDTYFGGDDSARSWWNPELNMVYVNNSQFLTSGTMGFRGAPATPADRYYGGHYGTGNQEAAAGWLSNSTNSNYVDAGYYLQWNRSSLAPGDTWVIEAFESWTDPTFVQVLAPSSQLVTPGSTATLSFGVHNLDTSEHTFDLAALTDLGWDTRVVGDASITVPALTQVPVGVQVQVPADAEPDAMARVALRATDPISGSTGSSSTDLTVFDPDFTFSPETLSYGNVELDGTATLSVTLSNDGSTVEVGTVGSPNGVDAPFEIVSDECSGRTIPNGGECSVQVAFTPTSEGDANDSFNIPVLAPVVTSQVIAVQGTGAALPACDDGIHNGDETDVDCGGDCAPCEDGSGCAAADDCDSGVCAMDICQAPACDDGVLNGSEADVDCGGDCAPCDDGSACTGGSDCGSLVCGGGLCQAASCDDGVRNGTESDVDCGGEGCDPCESGSACDHTSDCESQVCAGGVCQEPACTDEVHNGTESDVDCGGEDCDPCPDGVICNAAADCASGVCVDHVCQAPSCTDMVKNGDETDEDCGGTSCAPCGPGEGCGDGSDCASGVCTDGMCVPPTCSDGVHNGDETDVDCGGQDCAPCTDGSACDGPGDCTSAVCEDGLCQAPTCIDGTKNGQEADVDCGGTACDPCADGRDCASPEDCVSRVCGDGACVPASCTDGVRNGGETDVDCGGPCDSCDAGLRCDEGTDCASGVCSEGFCQAPSCNDGVLNGQETDLDCGGSCEPCRDGSACGLPGDCASLRCMEDHCVPATCTDGVLNGTESDVDCGGSCPPCSAGGTCRTPDDCTSRVCDGTCQAPACDDGVLNGDESDVDCGGSCTDCTNGDRCNSRADCASGACASHTCVPPTCMDGEQNGGESDVDCGGACNPCNEGGTCAGGSDCESGVCILHTCATPTCTDGVQNGGESDVDCGGVCGPCSPIPSHGSTHCAAVPPGTGGSPALPFALLGLWVLAHRLRRRS
ncbi:MAG: hypothetical protein ACOC97_03895 [Myxococcota bacterium]